MSANECPDQKHLNNKVKQFTNEIRHKRINFGITHRFWATYRKVLDKNRLDLMELPTRRSKSQLTNLSRIKEPCTDRFTMRAP